MNSAVHLKTISIRFRFDPLLGAFSKVYGVDQHVSVDGIPKRIKKYVDSNENVLVWTGP